MAEAERNPGYPQYGGFFFARCSFTASHAFMRMNDRFAPEAAFPSTSGFASQACPI